jgi:glutamyl/glutaminyl-tRNA synthetase
LDFPGSGVSLPLLLVGDKVLLSSSSLRLQWDFRLPKALLKENRKIIDPLAERYFFVKNPVRLSVANATRERATLRRYPSADLGTRSIATGSEFWIAGTDARALRRGKLFRLMDLYNVKVIGVGVNGMLGKFAGKAVTSMVTTTSRLNKRRISFFIVLLRVE